MIKLIFAMGPNGEFGRGDGMPWTCRDEIMKFKEYTENDILVMSEATFKSLPFALPGRQSIVLSDNECYARNGDSPDLIIPTKMDLQSLCKFLDETSTECVCIIGGRKLLDEASHFVDAASISFMAHSVIEEGTDAFIRHEDIIDRLNTRLVVSHVSEHKTHRYVEWF